MPIEIVLAHGGGCWPCGLLTSIILLGLLLAVLSIPAGIVWLLVDVLRSRGRKDEDA